MKPISLKIQRILMWIPYLNLLNWLLFSGQGNVPGRGGWGRAKHSLISSGLMFLVFVPTSILVNLLPDAVWIGWLGFWLTGFVGSWYLIRVQEKTEK